MRSNETGKEGVKRHKNELQICSSPFSEASNFFLYLRVYKFCLQVLVHSQKIDVALAAQQLLACQ